MIRAIICDDEEAAHKIIRYFLNQEGLPIDIVDTAADGVSALRKIQEQKPDLVFMDIHMPGLDGFEVIKQLHQSRTKVIVITAYSTFSYAQQALRLGACDIISKPIDLDQLRDAIVRAIGWNFTSNDTLNHALLYIHQHYPEKITLEQLADASCCTASHLSHLFQRHFQLTATAYLNKYRITKSVQLLDSGSSIQEASYTVGYSSLNNFYKNFKLYMGQTPSAYQNRACCPKDGSVPSTV